MRKRRTKIATALRRTGTIALSLALVTTSLQFGTTTALAAEAGTWKGDVTAAMDSVTDAMGAADTFAEAQQNLQNAIDGLESAVSVEGLSVTAVGEDYVILQFMPVDIDNLVGYNVYWADKDLETTKFQLLGPDGMLAEQMSGTLDENGKKVPADEMTFAAEDVAGLDVIEFKVNMSTFKNNYFKVAVVTPDGVGTKTEAVKSPTAVEYKAILDELGRGLVATQKADGVFLSWRLLWDELKGGYFEDETGEGLTGYTFNVYKNGEKLATVTNSTNYLDTTVTSGLTQDMYYIIPVDFEGNELTEEKAEIYQVLTKDEKYDAAYLEFTTYPPASQTLAEIYGIETAVLNDPSTVISYTLNDASTVDVDGDGEYEILAKWSPSNAKDVSQWGYTGKQIIDCYKIDGTLLWRVDLGVNIRAGAHYTQHLAFDFEGDGQGEMIVKTAPGTKTIQYELDENGKNVMDENGYPKVAKESYITIPEDDVAAGVTNEDNYVMSNADYKENLVQMFMQWGVWSNYPEATREYMLEYWPTNLVECFSISPKWGDKSFYTHNAESAALDVSTMSVEDIQAYVPNYEEGDLLVPVALEVPTVDTDRTSAGRNAQLMTVLVEEVKDYTGGYDLASVSKDVAGVGYTREEAEILAGYFMDHYGYTNYRHLTTTFEGFILSGPEYITLFDAKTGAELDTQDYAIGREDDGLTWGDYGWFGGKEPGNRVDRYNSAVVYLDGVTPSAVLGRGYYARTAFEAWNVVDGKLVLLDTIDSGPQMTTNPFNDSGEYKDGIDPVNGKMSGQGQHYITAVDANLDGRQEIINGGLMVTLNKETNTLEVYNAGGDYINGEESRGWKKHYHGDMMHITDIDPDLPGLEIASCFEGGGGPYDWAVRTLYTNNTLFGTYNSKDTARFTIGDTNPDVRGIEIVSGGVSASGELISIEGSHSTNQNIKWAADMTTQFISGAEGSNASIGGHETFLVTTGYTTGNSTKGNPALVADLLGDSREELLVRANDSKSMRIYTNTEVSTVKNYTLMQNLQYRAQVASQQSAYNMPSYTDYYYAADTDWQYVTIPNRDKEQEGGQVEVEATSVSLDKTVATVTVGETLQLTATVAPSFATQTVTWTVDNAEVATVDENGLVTAVKAGTAVVTATTVNGLTATANVTVKDAYVEDDIETVPHGTTWTYKFGTSVEVAEGEVAVKADTAYTAEAGYGWEANSVTLTDGETYVAGNNVRTTSEAGIVTWEYPTFLVDVPVGVYDVKIVQGTNGTDDAVNGAYVEGWMYASRWSNVNFGTSYDEPAEDSWIKTEAGKTQESTVTVAVPDGQLTIDLATSLTNEGVSGTTYIKEIVITRKEQITAESENPTLRFIGDSTLAKYPPTDDGTWTPIPERTGWGEEFSMGKFVDESVVLVNKAVAGSSLKSYIYDGYYNDFFLNSNPGDTVIIESGINDSAGGRRYSDDAEFEAGLRYLIESCQAFGLDVIISSGTSSAGNYTAKMEALATEFNLPYVDLLGQWGTYKAATGTTDSLTVDGTHLKRVGGIVAAQLVANAIKDLEGLSISGYVNPPAMNYEAPTAVVNGLYVKAQTEGSTTLAWNIPEETIYDVDQLITNFKVYRKAAADDAGELVATQTAYVSAGMNAPQLYTTVEADGKAYYYYVTVQGVTGEGPKSADVQVAAFTPDDSYKLNALVEQYNSQMYDASVYTVESYAALKLALNAGEAVLANSAATAADITAALKAVEEKVAALQLNATEMIKTDFQSEALKTAPWGVSGSHSGLMSAIMDATGNRMLKLYVEAAGGRTVNKVFDGAADVNAAIEMVEFEWYPGNPDVRNVTEVEFYSTDANRVLSLKTSNNGHIGYVVGNYPTDSIAYMQGTGFHEYEGSKAVDLGLTNEAWYNVKIVFNFADNTADLYIAPRDDASIDAVAVEDITIDAAGSNTITKMNYLLARGKNDAGGNDLSILWDSYYDNYAVYYAAEKSTATTTEYEAALAAYEAKVAGLGSAAMADEKLALAEVVVDIMEKEVGFFTAADYTYAVDALKAATEAAPELVKATSVEVKADDTDVIANVIGAATVTATLSEGANEEVVWSSSDETIATVEGVGLNAVVNTLKTGTVTITAKGATSGVEGSIELNVVGDVYNFGSDVTVDSVYSRQNHFGFVDYTYPNAAAGWVDGVYYDRELVEVPGASYINTAESTADYLAIKAQVWGENEGGRDEDLITYENTSAFVIDKQNGDFTIGVTFYNPEQYPMTVMVKAEDIRRYDYGDHATSQLGEVTIPAGETVSAVFDLALMDEQITLRFEQKAVDASLANAGTRTVYVKSVSVKRNSTAADVAPEKEWIFTDVEINTEDWIYNAVNYVYQNSYMNGVDMVKGLFAPQDTMTRAMFVQTLYNMEGTPAVETTDRFVDVTDSDWFAKAVAWAYAEGITSGVSPTEFGSMTNINREQIVTLVYNYAKAKGYDMTSEEGVLDRFVDGDKVSSWAIPALEWAVSNGIISGKPQNDGTLKFEPAVSATRAECATIMKNFCGNFIDLPVEDVVEDDVDYNDKVTVFTAGDSTVQSYTQSNYRNGWAQLLYNIFGTEVEGTRNETSTGYAYYETEDAVVVNYARDARSAKSFLEEGRLNELLLDLDEGDYVFVQFAHNDDNAARPNRFLSVDEYKEMLVDYNEAITSRGATLVLVTPIVLNVFNEDGSLDHRFDDYRLGMMQIAAENDIPVIDLMGSTLELVTTMGATNVANLALYMSDTVHTAPAGAKMFATLVGNLIQASDDAKLDALKGVMDVKAADTSVAIDCADTLVAGETADITVTEGAHIYISDESVVKIVDGKLVAVAPGQAIITAGTVVGDTATVDCTAYTTYKVVTVEAADVETVAVETAALNTEVTAVEVEAIEALADDGVATNDGKVTVYADAEIEGMMASPLADYQFDFGTRGLKNSYGGTAGAPFKTISSATAYSAEVGYGFVGEGFDGIQFDKQDSGYVVDGFTPANEYETALAAALIDSARLSGADLEFAIDLPAGEYCINMYLYDGWSGNADGAKFYINDVEIGTHTYAAGTHTLEDITVSGRVVVTENAQVVLKVAQGAKSWAFLNAITVNEYVERSDAYNADAWAAVSSSIDSLMDKAAMFADDSTPMDYNASLVYRMVTTRDALDAVSYMPLASTIAGDELYALAEAELEQKVMYTVQSVEKLQVAMEAYNVAKGTLDITATVREASDVIDYWLMGVNTENVVEPKAWYFDFNTTQTGRTSYNDALAYAAPGWTPVGVSEGHPGVDLYSEETGYGVLAGLGGRNRGIEDLMLTDWAGGGTIFKVDLPAGTYNVTTYSFDNELGNTATSQFDFYVDYVDDTTTGTNLLSLAKITESKEVDEPIVRNGQITLAEAKTVTMVSAGYVNGVIFEEDVPVEVASYDIAKLEQLIADAKFDSKVEEDYSVSSWAAFKTAYETAVAKVAAAPLSVQDGEAVYTALSDALNGLVLRAGIVSYNIDFGPATDSVNGDPQIEANGQSGTDFETRAVEGAVRPAFQLVTGEALYATNVSEDGFHYGFDQVVASGNTAAGGAYFRDWVYAADSGKTPYTFKADLPAGDYFVFVYTGVKEGDANTTKLLFGNEVLETTNTAVETNADGETVYVQQYNAGGQYPYANATYVLHVEENPDALSEQRRVKVGTLEITVFDDTSASTRTGCLNGLEIFPVRLDAPIEPDDGEVTVDKTALATEIASAEALVAAEYTEESYAAVTIALEAAKTVNADEAATQEAVDTAVANLQAAVAALVKAEVVTADKTALNAKVTEAKAITADAYSVDSFTALTTAITAAETAAANEAATQEEVDKALTDLTAAITALVEVTKVGTADCSTGYMGASSSSWKVASGESQTVEFKNYTDGVNNWDNFLVVLQNTAEATDEGYEEYGVLRADNAGMKGALNTWSNLDELGWELTSQWNWDTFKTDLNGADVKLTVTNNASGTATVYAEVITAAGTSYWQKYDNIAVDGDLYFRLSVEKAYLEILGANG